MTNVMKKKRKIRMVLMDKDAVDGVSHYIMQCSLRDECLSSGSIKN